MPPSSLPSYRDLSEVPSRPGWVVLWVARQVGSHSPYSVFPHFREGKKEGREGGRRGPLSLHVGEFGLLRNL